MGTTVNAYLNFNGRCREAMTFYKECLGGELTFQTVEGTPAEAQCPESMKHYIMHSTLQNGTLILMASDMGLGEFIQGNNFALSVNCSSEEEINDFYAKLPVGGEIIDPLKVQFWGAQFAVFQDKFGIRWMLHYDKNYGK